MKRKVKITIFLLVILVLIIAAYFILNKYIFADINQKENITGAENYLTALKNRITFDYWNNLVKKGSNSGFEKNILANISDNPEDYEAFTRMRVRLFNYISDLKGYDIRAPEPPKNTSKIIAELTPQEPESGINLLKNGGFEESGKGDLPTNWQNQWKDGGSKSLDQRVKRSGKNSWRFEQDLSDGFQGSLSDYIKIKENQTYKFSAWIKTKAKTRILVQWYEFENDQVQTLTQAHNSYLGLGMNDKFETGDGWQKITTAIKAREASTKYIRIKIASFEGEVWWDDLSLINVNSEYAKPFGCLNNNLAKCVDVGSGEENKAGEIADIETEMSSGEKEGSINYRLIPPHGSIEVSFPEFNTDDRGIPKTAMMLEIGYKDTLDYPDKGKTAYAERAVVYSKIGYQAKDKFLYGYTTSVKSNPECQKSKPTNNEPDTCYPSDRIDYAILRLGDINDNQWKYAQFFSPKTGLPLIRALGGRFIFKIVMPKSKEHESSFLPINYVVLRAVSDSDFDRFDEKQRELLGYYQVNFVDKPSGSVNYLHKDLVLFSRDIMRPIYKETIPQPDEVNRDITAFSTLGEIEPVSFGIYSGAGLNGLTFTVDDLRKGKELIPKENIVLKKVVYEKRRLMPEDFFSYALVPDRLEDFNKLSIEAGSSARIWADVKVPDKLSGGEYQGVIRVNKDGAERTKINLKLTVLPLILSQPESTSYTWGDPVNMAYANNIEKLFESYRDYQLTTLIHLHPNDYRFVERNGSIADIDFDNLIKRINYYGAKGILKKNQPISMRIFAEDLYKKIYPGFSFSDNNLYSKLGSSQYAEPFKRAVQGLMEIAKAQNISFVFEVADEPNTIEERIYADRLTQFIKDSGGTTIAQLTSKSEEDLTDKNISPFVIPSASLPLTPLSKSGLLDNKIWNLTIQGEAKAANFANNYGYYTTRDSYLRTPINNRFLHGMLAYKTEAKFVYAYAAAAWWNDPYRDFDIRPNWPLFAGIEPDRIFVYPTASGELIPAMNAEGLREGIKDAKYIATLKELIASNKNIIIRPSGTLIKAEDSPAIYLLENNKKKPIVSWSIFASQFNFKDVVVVSLSEVNGYPLAEPVKYQDGALVKTKDNPAVYVIENGQRRHIPSSVIFNSLGYSWGAIILAEDNSIVELHPAAEPIVQTNIHPDGTLIKTASSPDIYFLRDGKKRLIISPSVFNSRFVSWGRIIIISQTEMDSYPLGDNLGYRNGALFKLVNEPAVYAVEHQKKRPIKSPAVFNQLGYKWENIILAENTQVADLLPLGLPLN